MCVRPFLFLLFVFFALPSQVSAQDSTTADGLFQLGRDAAFNQKDYPAAIRYAKQALILAPEYVDVITFLGRVYTWSEQADSARKYFQRAIHLSPSAVEVYTSYADMEYWN